MKPIKKSPSCQTQWSGCSPTAFNLANQQCRPTPVDTNEAPFLYLLLILGCCFFWLFSCFARQSLSFSGSPSPPPPLNVHISSLHLSHCPTSGLARLCTSTCLFNSSTRVSTEHLQLNSKPSAYVSCGLPPLFQMLRHRA